MRIQCNQESLAAGLSVATRALAARSPSPILDGVKVTTCEEGVRLTCTDLGLGIETTVEATVLSEGACVLPGKLFFEMIKKLPGGDMEISTNARGVATITCPGSRMTLTGMPFEEYPALPDIGDAKCVTLPMQMLKDMVQRTNFAIATDEVRPILTGCLIESDGRNLSIVALDGFRLALRRQDFAHDIPELSAIVQGKVLGEVARIVPDSDDPMTMKFGKTHLECEMAGTRLIARLLDGEFVNFKQIVPTQWTTRMTAPKKELEAAIDRASLMAREGKSNLIRLHLEENLLTITANAELGDVREEVPVTVEGLMMDIAFNVRYVSDTLKAIEDDTLVVRFTTNVSPCVFCPPFGERYLYLTLPVRIFQS